MAKHRIDFLTDGVWRSLSPDAPFSLRNHRVAISYSTPESTSVSVEAIVAVLHCLLPALASSNVPARKTDPTALLGWIDDLTSPPPSAAEAGHNHNSPKPLEPQRVGGESTCHHTHT